MLQPFSLFFFPFVCLFFCFVCCGSLLSFLSHFIRFVPAISAQHVEDSTSIKWLRNGLILRKVCCAHPPFCCSCVVFVDSQLLRFSAVAIPSTLCTVSSLCDVRITSSLVAGNQNNGIQSRFIRHVRRSASISSADCLTRNAPSSGGVIVGSPIVGAMKYELLHSLPSNYLNVGITAQGKTGAFQLLEEGKLNVNEFYERFGRELSEVKRGGEAYRRYCQKMGLGEISVLISK